MRSGRTGRKQPPRRPITIGTRSETSFPSTRVTTSAAPFFGQARYGGGKLGVYSFWDTVNPTNAPIEGINNNSTAPNQYEFYNYSPSRNGGSANPQEIGNEYNSNPAGSPSALAEPYFTDFFNTGNNSGINVRNELYQLNTGGSNSNNIQQLEAAIQTAFNNYIGYLNCVGDMTGNNGQPVASNNNTGSCLTNPYLP